jgi:dsDNA-binding SOS-regulon protein
MAVGMKYYSTHDEDKMFDTKKEAEALDKQLEAVAGFTEALISAGTAAGVTLNSEQAQQMGVYLGEKHAEQMLVFAKSFKSKKTPDTAQEPAGEPANENPSDGEDTKAA